MRILVLGGEGQIGLPFCVHARLQGHTVISYDLKTGKDLRYGVPDIDFDVCIFLAFEVGGSKYLEMQDSMYSYITANVDLMASCFDFLRRKGKPFLFASSQMSNMFNTNYGLLKCLGERYTKSLNGHICRFWNVYGYERFDDPKSHVITDFVHMALTDKVIRLRTTGEEKRQFLHVNDCSRALLHWCENHHLYSLEYIDITSFKWTSILDVARIVSNFTEAQVIPGKKIDSVQSGKKNRPSKEILQFWHPVIKLESGIKDIINIQTAQIL